ncbi:MAG: ribokinase [Planctomycetes bacterium]|nr:ribokinase [Planctomycetota bacterium]
MKKKIVVIGSSNTDMILETARIPKPGETILGGKFSIAAGGKGANQAVAVARAGGDVHFVGRLGNDMFGRQAMEGFKKEGIKTEHIFFDDEAASGVALIFVAEDGQNSIGVGPGANGNLTSESIIAAADVIASADIVLMQLEIPIAAANTAAKIAKDNGVKCILNPAPARELSDKLLGCVSILTPNETEAQLLTGIRIETEDDCLKAAEILQRRGVGTVIITLGAKGAFVLGHEFCGLVEGFKAEAVDTTAAGDVFNGVLAVGIAEGMPLKRAVTFANAAGLLSVTKLGAQPSAPYLADIQRLYESREE